MFVVVWCVCVCVCAVFAVRKRILSIKVYFFFLLTCKSSGTKRFRDTQYFTGASQDTCITTIGPDDIIIPTHFCLPTRYYFYRYYFLI